MADVPVTQIADFVKVVGSASDGTEQTPVESSTNGELYVGEKNLTRTISGAATVTVKSGAGYLRRITINRPTNGTATVYDNTTATGTPIIIIGSTNGTAPTTLEYGFGFTTGLTIVTTGANLHLSVVYL